MQHAPNFDVLVSLSDIWRALTYSFQSNTVTEKACHALVALAVSQSD